MKLSDSIKYSFLRTIRDKKNIYFIIIMMISLVSLMLVTIYKNYYFDSYENMIKNDIDFRSIIVHANSDELEKYINDRNYDLKYDELLNIEHTVDIYNFDYNNYGTQSPTYKGERYNGYIELLYGTKETIPDVIIGEKIDENDTEVAICPNLFYPSGNIDSGNIDDYIYGKDLLNTQFDIEEEIVVSKDGKNIYTGKYYNKKFKIVGIYDAQKVSNQPFACYISKRDIEDLYDITFGSANENSVNSMLLIVDNSSNIEEVIKEVIGKGYEASAQAYIDQNKISSISSIFKNTLLIVFIIITLLVISYIKKNNNDKTKELKIKKAIGYNLKDIFSINLIAIQYLLFASYLISIAVVEITSIIIKSEYKAKIIFNGFTSYLHYFEIFIFSIIFIEVISIISAIYFTKKTFLGNNRSNYK